MTERPPTQSQIEYILSGIKPISVSPDARQAMAEGIKAPLREILSDETLTPEDIEQLKFAIDRYFASAQVVPGEAVGPIAATSIGEPSTQMELSSHRLAGASLQSGIPRFEELVRVATSISQKQITSSIYFNQRYTLSELRDLIPLFVSRNLEKLILRYEIQTKQSLPESNWHQRFRLIYNIQAEQPNYILRFHLNIDELQRYRLTLEQVALELRKVSDTSVIFFSSNNLGLIDIYEQKPEYQNEASYMTEDNVLRYYLRDIVLPKMLKQNIIGIPNITDAEPKQILVSDSIQAWNGRQVIYNSIKGRDQGISLDQLEHLLQEAGYTIVRKQNNVIYLKDPGGLVELNDKLTQDVRLRDLNVHWYLLTRGSNLPKVLAMDIVNNEITFTSDLTEIQAVFGVQAARDYLLSEMIQIMGSNAYMDPRHLIILAEVMANLGILTPATSAGVSRQRIGPMTQSAFERPVQHFLRAAAFGEGEIIRGLSASIFVGSKARIGPSAFLAPSIPEEEEEEHALVLVPGDLILPVSELGLEEVPINAPLPQIPTRVNRPLPAKIPMTGSASVIPATAPRPLPTSIRREQRRPSPAGNLASSVAPAFRPRPSNPLSSQTSGYRLPSTIKKSIPEQPTPPPGQGLAGGSGTRPPRPLPRTLPSLGPVDDLGLEEI